MRPQRTAVFRSCWSPFNPHSPPPEQVVTEYKEFPMCWTYKKALCGEIMAI